MSRVQILFYQYCYFCCYHDVVLFNWVSKVIRNCFGFALLYSVIGPQNSNHSLNQSGAKLKPVRLAPVTRVFPRFRQFGWFHFEFSLALNSIYFLLIGCSDYLVLVSRHSSKSAPSLSSLNYHYYRYNIIIIVFIDLYCANINPGKEIFICVLYWLNKILKSLL